MTRYSRIRLACDRVGKITGLPTLENGVPPCVDLVRDGDKRDGILPREVLNDGSEGCKELLNLENNTIKKVQMNPR